MYEAPLVMLLGFIIYFIVYNFYVKWFDKNIMEADAKRSTPAHMYMDGVEFFPTSRYVLLGFQSKSITGLGPVFGVVNAITWGWLPGLIWILVGNTFIGWIQDYNSLMASVRHEGSSFGPISHALISPLARLLMLSFIFFNMSSPGSLTMVVGAYKSFPIGGFAIVLTTVVAVVFGYLVYRVRMNILYTTVGCVVLMFVGMAALVLASVPGGPLYGTLQWLAAPANALMAENIWFLFIMAWTTISALLPVWSFMTPVNYLAFYMVWGFQITLLLAIFTGMPSFNQPAFTSAGAFTVPTAIPPLWPMMFVTIMCGSISGWHSLVSSSGSSKQLDSEADARFIGAGSMLMEGIVALTSVCAVGVLVTLGAAGGPRYVAGSSQILGLIGIPSAFGMAWASQFIGIQHITLTQIGLRFGRMSLSELLGGKIRAFRNKYVCIAPVLILWLLLGHSYFGAIADYIWRMGGGINQLQAGLALTIITVWMIARRKPWFYTGIPMAFMLVTTIVSLIYSAWTFLYAAGTATGAAVVGLYGATLISVILICLGGAMVFESFRAISRTRAQMAATAVAAGVTPGGVTTITPAPETSKE